MPDERPLPIAPVPALVLAGGKTGPEFAAAAGVPDLPGARALAEVGGVPMVRHVLRALQQAETVGPVLLVGPGHFPDQPEADERVIAEGGLEENVREALKRVPDAPFFLVATADLLFLTAESVDDFVRRSAALDVDCCYSAVSRADCEARFPGMHRTYLRIGRESYTGGNLVYQRTAAYEKQATLLREAYRRRKDPLFLAGMIGPWNVAKFLLRRLTLEDIGAAASRLMGTRCRMVVSPYAEVGTDIDRPEDLAIARSRLGSPSSSD